MKSVVLNLQITCLKYSHIPNKHIFQYWLNSFLPSFKFRSEVNIRIVDILESKSLNFKYRGKSKPTNVLSFPFQTFSFHSLILLGDIVICRQIIEIEAIQQNKTFNAHLAHIVIHGCLHLLGYKHKNFNEKKKMETIEIKIMKNIGYKNPYIH